MRRTILHAFCLCLLLVGLTGPAAAKRVALVIGNSNYQHVSQLPNPGNDAADMQKALVAVGFEVERHGDLTFDALRRALRDFSDRAAGAEMALVYFAGHGIEVAKQNYLIPVDARLKTDRDVQFEAVPLDFVLSAVEGAKGLRLVLLDACRNNPFAASMTSTSSTRSIGRGLARVEPTAGTLVSYAAKGGTTADDGEGRNSPYTAALIANLGQPGLEINFLFRKVRDDVVNATGGRQEPFTYGSLPSERIYLKAPQTTATAGNQSTGTAPATTFDHEALFWSSVKDSTNSAILQTYLNKYPEGQFADLARVKLAELNQAATSQTRQSTDNTSQKTQVTTLVPTNPPPNTTGPDVVSLPAAFWPVGKWPEGIVSDGQSLWIAESGQRKIAQLSQTDGRVLKRVKVGRLPVNMTSTSDGRVFALVHTDGLVWSQSNGRGKKFAKLKDYPAGMVGDDEILWVLTNPGGSSAQAKVVRLDQRNGQARASQLLGQNASDLAVAHGKLWVVHGTGGSGQISVLHPRSLDFLSSISVATFANSIAASEHGVFVAGGKWNEAGAVLKFDGATGAETARRALPGQFIGVLETFQDKVIAIGMQGTIWVLSGRDLSIERVITVSAGQFEPRSILATAGTLFITTHRGQGENGSVVAVNGWQGATVVQTTVQSGAAASAAGVWKFNGFTSSEESEGRGQSYSASVDVTGAAADMSFSLTCYPTDKQIELAMQGREEFEAIAQAAIEANRGRFGGQDSHIDLVIEGQAYPLKATFFGLNGELNLDTGYRPNGRIVNGLLKASGATLNTSKGAIAISLRNSRKVICQTLSQCGVSQSYCQSKGQ